MPISRRDFLVTAALASGALVVGCRRSGDAEAGGGEGPTPLGFWISILPDGAVRLRLSKLEMGQGAWTMLAVLVAEELEVEPGAIRRHEMSTDDVREAPPFEERARPDQLLEAGSSLGVTLSWLPVRTTAAAAREMLVAAAAARWGVEAGECVVSAGRVRHDASGRSAHYGELVEAAAKLPVPAEPALKPADRHARIGRPTLRVEAPEVAAGTARYGCDVRLPGQLYAALARPPLGAAGPPRFDEAAARAVPGVRTVLPVRGGVAVVADSSWAALSGRDRLGATWKVGPGAPSSTAFAELLESAFDAPLVERYDPKATEPHAVTVATSGRVPSWSGAAVAARYATPFQAHATMEPPNAVARWEEPGRVEIWAGTQWPQRTKRALARELDIETERILIHTYRMGGSFGRKEAPDFVIEAARIARELPGTPIQLLWSRADDLGHGRYHPPTRHRLAGELRDGRIAAWRHRVVSPSIEKQHQLLARKPNRIPPFEAAGAWDLPYAVADLSVEYVDVPCPFRLGFWRGIEIVSNIFAVESFVDELASSARLDPIELRLRSLAAEVPAVEGASFPGARLAAVLELAARRSGWATPLPAGRGRGVAGIVFDARSACATVAEVTVAGGEWRVDRLLCVLDCGVAVNPLGVEAQVEGALAWGLSALSSEITFAAGRAEQRGHIDYPILRYSQMPEVEVAIVPSAEPPSAVGEVAVPTVAPAVANAIFAACGRRPRRLPIRAEDLA